MRSEYLRLPIRQGGQREEQQRVHTDFKQKLQGAVAMLLVGFGAPMRVAILTLSREYSVAEVSQQTQQEGCQRYHQCRTAHPDDVGVVGKVWEAALTLFEIVHRDKCLSKVAKVEVRKPQVVEEGGLLEVRVWDFEADECQGLQKEYGLVVFEALNVKDKAEYQDDDGQGEFEFVVPHSVAAEGR